MSIGNTIRPFWLKRFVDIIHTYRYAICIIIMLLIFAVGLYLRINRHWSIKETAQLCTGFLIVITLLFAQLNFEFSNVKMQLDYKAARELLTYSTAQEWYKAPIKDFQKTSILFENNFIRSKSKRTSTDFAYYIEDINNIEFRESLKGILNYFESSSTATNRGLIDKDFIKEFFYDIYTAYYKDYLFYIEGQRAAKSSSNVWINFTNLVEEWQPAIRQQITAGNIKSIIINVYENNN
ncbi:MAG: hypothetical protein DI535_12285 [Citrobacter freundii]|nr:MAG: hypothetical protein DI535_12285 [Citrobacter freundii]